MSVNSSKKSPVPLTILLLIELGLCCCQASNETNTSINETNTSVNETSISINETNTSSSRDNSMTTDESPELTPEELEHSRMVQHMLKIHVFLVTFPCILLFSFVFASYVCIQRQQRLHGWIVLAITGSLALRFGVTIVTDLPSVYFEYWLGEFLPEFCATLGVMHHLLFLMCYCWSLVLAFDLMRRVRTVTKLNGREKKDLMRFGAYCAFGFGVPLFIVILAAILEWGVSDLAGTLKPDYSFYCRVEDTVIYYFSTIPCGILVALNLACLSAGIWFLWKAKKASAGAAGGGAIQKNLAALVVKVFVLMGGLIIADFAIHQTGLYNYSPYFMVIFEFLCRVGYALGFVWVFIFGGTAKEQLRGKFPRSFGLVFDTLDGGSKAEEGNTMTHTSSVAHMSAV